MDQPVKKKFAKFVHAIPYSNLIVRYTIVITVIVSIPMNQICRKADLQIIFLKETLDEANRTPQGIVWPTFVPRSSNDENAPRRRFRMDLQRRTEISGKMGAERPGKKLFSLGRRATVFRAGQLLATAADVFVIVAIFSPGISRMKHERENFHS